MTTLDKLLQAYYALEERPSDLCKLLKDHDFQLLPIDHRVAQIVVIDDLRIICINHNIERKEFYILHEFAHYLLHINKINFLEASRKAENEANMFACLYLLNGNLYDEYYEYILKSYEVPNNVIERYRDMLYQYMQVQTYGIGWLRLECF